MKPTSSAAESGVTVLPKHTDFLDCPDTVSIEISYQFTFNELFCLYNKWEMVCLCFSSKHIWTKDAVDGWGVGLIYEEGLQITGLGATPLPEI